MTYFLLFVIIALVYILWNEVKVNQRKTERLNYLEAVYSKSSVLCHRRGMMITLYESGFTPEQVKNHFKLVDQNLEALKEYRKA